MKAHFRITLLALAALPLAAASVSAQTRLYRWVDDKGVVHYGDRVPPEYANRDRDVLNDRGIAVGREQGELSEQEKEAQRQRQAAEAHEREARAEIVRRDRMLLETYLSVADIERLRDQRLELLEGQINVTELYLSGLRENLDGLNREAQRYKPLSDREDARPLPADLADDITRTKASIELYEDTLERARVELTRVRDAFDSDIARFRELKGS